MTYSSINKLKSIIAYLLRFKNNFLIESNRSTGQLTVDELQNALDNILIITQVEQFSSELSQLTKITNIELNSQLCLLNPFLDNQRLIREGERLKKFSLLYSEKHSIVLPRKHCYCTFDS
jgi:hypothetical protein